MRSEAYEVGDVVLTDFGDEVTVLDVYFQDEGPAYRVRYDSGMTTILFHEEIAEV